MWFFLLGGSAPYELNSPTSVQISQALPVALFEKYYRLLKIKFYYHDMLRSSVIKLPFVSLWLGDMSRPKAKSIVFRLFSWFIKKYQLRIWKSVFIKWLIKKCCWLPHFYYYSMGNFLALSFRLKKFVSLEIIFGTTTLKSV